METTCIRHTELPNTTRLFADLVYHFDRVAKFYQHAPYDYASFEAAAKQIDFPLERRAAIVAALAEQNPGNPSLKLLAEPNGLAVVTGQQVGLFSGPAYTIFKALAAVRLAADLTAKGTPAAPVFWLATEDHDLAEINQSWVFNDSREPVGLHSRSENPACGPVGPIHVLDAPLEGLREALARMPYGAEVDELVTECYQPGVSFGAAFLALLRKLLGKYNILFLDPLAPAIRALGAPFLEQAVQRSADLNHSLLERSRDLESAGYHSQVHVELNTSLVFLLENGRRIALKRQGEVFVNGSRSWTSGELGQRSRQLSPNALLRPVMQDYLLPTVAYFGGPAELAYFAQSEVLYRALLGRMPVMLHRASFTLLDGRTRKLQDRYRISLTESLIHETGLRERIARSLVPLELNDRFEGVRSRLELDVKTLQQELLAFDPSLEKAMAKSAGKMFYQLEKMQGKAARQALRKEHEAQTHASYLHNSLYPHRHMQERFYSILPFLAEYGLELIDHIYDHVQVQCPDHQVLPIH